MFDFACQTYDLSFVLNRFKLFIQQKNKIGKKLSKKDLMKMSGTSEKIGAENFSR